MGIEIIEKHFCSFLDKFWKLNNMAPFLLVYLRLLLLFKNELSKEELDVVLKRQRQLSGEKLEEDNFEALRKFTRNKMDGYIRNNADFTREAMLNRLLFCALLDTEENDFFYLTEPMFEFAQKMQVSPDQLTRILESEFIGFRDNWDQGRKA